MEDVSRQLREGMEVRTSDGTKLGKVDQIWYGTAVGGPLASDEETCIEVRRGFLGREHLYLPCRIVSNIDQNMITLSVDEQTISGNPKWHQKPAWTA